MIIFAIRDEAARHEVEEALDTRFEPHESLYLGGDYWLAKLPASGVSIRIRHNRDLMRKSGDPDCERFAFPEHSQHELILDVDGDTSDVVEKLLRLPSLELLERRPTSRDSA